MSFFDSQGGATQRERDGSWHCTKPDQWKEVPAEDASDEEILAFFEHLEECSYHTNLWKDTDNVLGPVLKEAYPASFLSGVTNPETATTLRSSVKAIGGDLFNRCYELFKDALDLPAKQRSSFLESKCLDNLVLRHTVEDWLRDYEKDYDLSGETISLGLVADAKERWWRTDAIFAQAMDDTFSDMADDRATDSLVGQDIDSFRILEVIGKGGMGAVYKAHQVGVDREVVVKRILQKHKGNELVEGWFYREAAIQATLEKNPHFVNIYHKFKHEHGDFIVMEFVDGRTVKELLKDGPIAWEQALPIFKQSLEAFKYLHDNEIIHRDIKPGNIMVTEDGLIKVIDFGLAKRYETGGEDTFAVAGTLAYMSPEQRQGLRHTDYRSDVFSLGITFYEMLVGRRPPSENDDGNRRISDAPLADRSVPLGLVKVIMKALELEKEKRYQNAGEMLAHIEAFETEMLADTEALETERKTRLLLWWDKYSMKTLELRKEKRYQNAGEMLAHIEAFETERKTRFLLWWDKYYTHVYFIVGIVVSVALAIISIELSNETLPPTAQTIDSPQENPEFSNESVQDALQRLLALGDSLATDTAPLLENEPEPPEPGDVTPSPEETVVSNDPAPEDTDGDEEPEALVGVLTVTSEPEGASIFLDDASQPIGTTPFTILDIPVGAHVLVLTREDHENYTGSVTVRARQTENVEVPLIPLMGTLTVRVWPVGALFVDGLLVKDEVSISTLVELTAGRHKVVIDNPDHGRWESEVIISPDTPLEIFVDFVAPVEVTISVRDEQGTYLVIFDIFVDGDYVNSGPRRIDVGGVGLHTIEVRSEGYTLVGGSEEINFVHSLTDPLEFVLRRNDP